MSYPPISSSEERLVPARALSQDQISHHRGDASTRGADLTPATFESRRRELPPLQQSSAGNVRPPRFQSILNPSPPDISSNPSRFSLVQVELTEHAPALNRGFDEGTAHGQPPSFPPSTSSGTRRRSFDLQFHDDPGQNHPSGTQAIPQPVRTPLQDQHSGHSTPARTWPLEAYQQRRESSVADSDQHSGHSTIASTPGQAFQLMTLETADGPIDVPVNIQSASRAADEKRRRNAGASARFRQRRKEKEEQSNREIDILRQQMRETEEDAEFYRRERDYFASIVYNGPDRSRHFPRPDSPRRIRLSGPAVSLNASSGSPSTYNTRQENVTQDTVRNTKRRLGGEDSKHESVILPPHPPTVEGYNDSRESIFPQRPDFHQPSTPNPAHSYATQYYEPMPPLQLPGPPASTQVQEQRPGVPTQQQNYPPIITQPPHPPFQPTSTPNHSSRITGSRKTASDPSPPESASRNSRHSGSKHTRNQGRTR